MLRQIHIFGASGFVGNHLVVDLKRKGLWEVFGYSSQECNLLELDECLDLLSNVRPDSIFIFVSGVTRLVNNGFSGFEANTRMAQNMCQIIEKFPIAHLVFMSSIDVYGADCSNGYIDEYLLPDPADYYAVSKLASEQILKIGAKQSNFILTIFRLSGVYGPGDSMKSTINTMTESLLATGNIKIFGSGGNLRDFVWVKDVSELVAMTIQNSMSGVFNIATGDSQTIHNIAKKIVNKCQRGEILFEEVKVSLPKRVEHLRFNISKVKESFPDFKFTSLDDGIGFYVSSL